MAAGETAGSIDWSDNAIEDRAVQDERSRFIELVKTADVHELATLPVLPFRRVLGTDEHQQLHGEFRSRRRR